MRTLTGRARLAGVMGWPIAHSRSPRLHGFWLAQHDIDGAYLPLAVRPENLAAALRALPILGFAGVNITLPHKSAALGLVDRASPESRRIGAINTVVVGADGLLDGSNTDGYGFLGHLKTSAPGWKAAAGPAVLLGAGGAARAIAVALLDAGVPELRIANRTPRRAAELAAALGAAARPVDWDRRNDALAGASLLVNSTTLGMAGQPALEINLQRLPRKAVVYDIVYVPLETPLLAAARERGHTPVDGLGMLLHQALPGFAAWFGVTPEVSPELREFVLAAL
jgi:shikimate dehydrogenase